MLFPETIVNGYTKTTSHLICIGTLHTKHDTGEVSIWTPNHALTTYHKVEVGSVE